MKNILSEKLKRIKSIDKQNNQFKIEKFIDF